jgi:tRNA1(Val) A37 N6-methylase TrmN6
MTADGGAFSDDAALGGRLKLRQPRRGHRFGHDAIILAAATPARPGERAVEFGAGVGAAGLALARRVERLAVTLVEIDPALAALAQHNAAENGLGARVRAICLDVAAAPAAFAAAGLPPGSADVAAPPAAFAAAGLPPGSADRVLMNPPFNTRQSASPDDGRRRAHAASAGLLPVWLSAAARLLVSGGTVTLIWRADDLGDVLTALAADFAGITIMPVYPKPDAPAIRVLVSASKDSKAPSSLLPGLTLADKSGKPTPQTESVLRDGAALAFP